MYIKKRLITFFIFVGLFTIVFGIGGETQVSKEDAEQFLKEFEAITLNIDAIGIFLHNLTIALPMFVPGFGIGWGFFASWQTGMAFAAFKTINPMLSQIPTITILFTTPFGMMELAAYAIGMSRSFLLIRKLIKKIPIKSDVKIVSIEAGIVVGLLLVGAIIEDYMIKLFQECKIPLPEF